MTVPLAAFIILNAFGILPYAKSRNNLGQTEAHDEARRDLRQSRGAAPQAGKPATLSATTTTVHRTDRDRQGGRMKGSWGLLWMFVAWAALMRLRLAYDIGVYGVALFGFLPSMMGALVDWGARDDIREALIQGGVTAAVGCAFFIAIGVEGLICMVMALPLAFPLGMLGSCLSFKLRTTRPEARSAALLLLPLASGPPAMTSRSCPASTRSPPRLRSRRARNRVEDVIAYTDMPGADRLGVSHRHRLPSPCASRGCGRWCDSVLRFLRLARSSSPFPSGSPASNSS